MPSQKPSPLAILLRNTSFWSKGAFMFCTSCPNFWSSPPLIPWLILARIALLLSSFSSAPRKKLMTAFSCSWLPVFAISSIAFFANSLSVVRSSLTGGSSIVWVGLIFCSICRRSWVALEIALGVLTLSSNSLASCALSFLSSNKCFNSMILYLSITNLQIKLLQLL